VPGLLDRRLIFVTGKGGVGKSTVAVALGLLGARRGARTIVVELAGQGRVRSAFSRAGETFAEIALAPGLWTISVEPEAAMEEYLRLRTGPLGQALGASRIFQAFAMATPGMRELLTMGKVWELAQPQRRTDDAEPYDLVIVDSPAAGHGLGGGEARLLQAVEDHRVQRATIVGKPLVEPQGLVDRHLLGAADRDHSGQRGILERRRDPPGEVGDGTDAGDLGE
jgi:anion-transporting  ArsA/GET3 family ATPase